MKWMDYIINEMNGLNDKWNEWIKWLNEMNGLNDKWKEMITEKNMGT